MKIIKTFFDSVYLIKPETFFDNRGLFYEAYNESLAGILPKGVKFVQTNVSHSKKNVFRGLHLQLPPNSQGKLCSVLYGAVIDIVVDIRLNSKTFGIHQEIILSSQDPMILWIPPGFAHGFFVKSEHATFEYSCTAPYDPSSERVLSHSDLGISAIKNYKRKLIMSDKDKKGLSLIEIRYCIETDCYGS
jgi:dTDP-4-dehydrorhamnose 3,5-epimerase